MNRRILHIRADTDALNPIEGATRMIQNYIHYADCAGFESYLLLICSGPDAQRAFTGIPPERLLLITDFSNRSLLKFSFWKKIISFIQENCIGILHSHSYKADLIAVMLKPFTRSRIVSTVHGYNPASERLKSRLLWQVYRNLWYFFDHVIVVAPAMLKIPVFKRLNKLGRITIVRNFIPGFSGIKRRPTPSGSPFTFLCIGRLSAEKNQILLCQAIKELHPGRELRCVLVGNGSQRAQIEQYITENNLDQQIILAGFQPEVLPFYLQADALVIPSLFEGLPLVLIEAMSLKCPVIAVDIGEIHDLLKDDSGLLFKRDSLESLVEKLCYAMDHPKELKTMAEKAYTIYQEIFSPADSARALLAVYERIRQINTMNLMG